MPSCLLRRSSASQADNSEGTDTQDFTVTVGFAPVCPTDTISNWKLDEESGPSYADAKGGNHGSCAGVCPDDGTGKISGGQVFDGSSTGIDVPDDGSFDWSGTGDFTIETDPERGSHYVAIAAGSGITPVLSMIESVLVNEPMSRFTLVYGNRDGRSIMFLDRASPPETGSHL